MPQQPSINLAERNETVVIHTSIATPSEATSAPGQGTTPVAFGALLGLEYDTATDAVYRTFKIPSTFTEEFASFHIHWTKRLDADASGGTIRWQIEYKVYDGISQNVASGSVIKNVDDTYEDASIDGTRIVYRTTNIDVTADFVPSWYVGVKLTYVAGSTTLSSNPVLISLDSLMRVRMNEAIA